MDKLWIGPYTFIKKINGVVFRIQMSPSCEIKVYYFHRVSLYKETVVKFYRVDQSYEGGIVT